MELAVALGVIVVILGVVLGVIIFAARRYGWRPVIWYLVFAVGVRVMMAVAPTHASDTTSTIVPLVVAAVFVILRPHVLKQRAEEAVSDPDSTAPPSQAADEP